jgi:hypothetical protein
MSFWMTRYRKLSGSKLSRGTRIRFMRWVVVLSSNSFASAGSPNVAFRSRQRTFSTLFFTAPLVALGSTSELPFLTGQCL